jgi:hypothetical protein
MRIGSRGGWGDQVGKPKRLVPTKQSRCSPTTRSGRGFVTGSKGYLEWLHVASREPLTRVEFLRELKLLPVLCAPFGLLLWQLAQRNRNALSIYLVKNRLFLLVLGGSLAAVAVSASKIGAGPHHFMPFYPIAGYVCAELYGEIQSSKVTNSPLPRFTFTLLLWLWLAAAVAVQIGAGFLAIGSTVLTPRSRAMAANVTSDLKKVMQDHPGEAIEMGYGSWNSYELTYFRPMLVFAGNPLTIDALSLDDAQLSGLQIPRSTLEYLQQCKTQIWLIPKGDAPFDLVNVFSLIDPGLFPERRLFSDEFRRIFFQRYRKHGFSKYFDIWECETELGLDASLPADSVAKYKDVQMCDAPRAQNQMYNAWPATHANMKSHAL